MEGPSSELPPSPIIMTTTVVSQGLILSEECDSGEQPASAVSMDFPVELPAIDIIPPRISKLQDKEIVDIFASDESHSADSKEPLTLTSCTSERMTNDERKDLPHTATWKDIVAVVEVPENRLIVPIEVCCGGVVEAVIDSGASRSVINETMVKRHNLPFTALIDSEVRELGCGECCRGDRASV